MRTITYINSVTGAEIFPDDVPVNPTMGDEIDDAYEITGVANVKSDTTYFVRPLPETKDTNPKDAIGISKAPLSVVPATALYLDAMALMEGALKYGRHNWREAGIRYSVYYDAMMRHMTAWWEGEDVDADSGLPHPAKAMACLTILLDAMVLENGHDDRPPKSPPGWMNAMNEHARSLLERFPDPKTPHTEL